MEAGKNMDRYFALASVCAECPLKSKKGEYDFRQVAANDEPFNMKKIMALRPMALG